MKKAVLAVTIVLVAALVCQAQDYKGEAHQGGVVFDEKGRLSRASTSSCFR